MECINNTKLTSLSNKIKDILGRPLSSASANKPPSPEIPLIFNDEVPLQNYSLNAEVKNVQINIDENVTPSSAQDSKHVIITDRFKKASALALNTLTPTTIVTSEQKHFQRSVSKKERFLNKRLEDRSFKNSPKKSMRSENSLNEGPGTLEYLTSNMLELSIKLVACLGVIISSCFEYTVLAKDIIWENTSFRSEIILNQLTEMKCSDYMLWPPYNNLNTYGDISYLQSNLNNSIHKIRQIGGVTVTIFRVSIVQIGYLIFYTIVMCINCLTYIISKWIIEPSINTALIFFNIDYKIEDCIDVGLVEITQNMSYQFYYYPPLCYSAAYQVAKIRTTLLGLNDIPFSVFKFCRNMRSNLDDFSTGFLSIISLFDLVYSLVDVMTTLTSLLSYALLNINFVIQTVCLTTSTLVWMASQLVYYLQLMNTGLGYLKRKREAKLDI